MYLLGIQFSNCRYGHNNKNNIGNESPGVGTPSLMRPEGDGGGGGTDKGILLFLCPI